MSKRCLQGLALVGLLLTGALLDRASSQQEGDQFSIRVEANEVFVPVYVVYKHRETKVSEEENGCWLADANNFRRLTPSQPYLPPDCNQSQIRGLGPNDFQLFEDGIGQKIRSVRYEAYPALEVRDSSGDHREYSLSSRGKWSFLDRSQLPGSEPDVAFHLYRLAYSPKQSASGSCHQIRVTVRRREAKIYARSHYCNVQYSPWDPLRGTNLGERLQKYENSADAPTIPLSGQTAVFRTSNQLARVNVSLEFPPKEMMISSMRGSLHGTIGIMGTIYKGQEIAGGFSDFACCDPDFSFLVAGEHPEESMPYLARAMVPERYITQFDLPPGEYKMKIVLGDGSKFGRIEMSLSIENQTANQLALSSVALCKRYLDAVRATKEAAAVNLAPQYVPLVSKGTQFEPAGDTRFRKGDPLIAYFEVYEPLLASEAKNKVQIRLKITNAQTGEMKADTGLCSADSWVESGGSTIHIAENISSDHLPPGTYRLEAQASDSVGRMTAWQTTTFSVEQADLRSSR